MQLASLPVPDVESELTVVWPMADQACATEYPELARMRGGPRLTSTGEYRVAQSERVGES